MIVPPVYYECENVTVSISGNYTFKSGNSTTAEILRRFTIRKWEGSAAVYPFLIVVIAAEFTVILALEVAKIALTKVLADDFFRIGIEYIGSLYAPFHGTAYNYIAVGTGKLPESYNTVGTERLVCGTDVAPFHITRGQTVANENYPHFFSFLFR